MSQDDSLINVPKVAPQEPARIAWALADHDSAILWLFDRASGVIHACQHTVGIAGVEFWNPIHSLPAGAFPFTLVQWRDGEPPKPGKQPLVEIATKLPPLRIGPFKN